jgi:hypothetical protein
MIGDTLTFENLKAIKLAMDKIKPIDQSDYFKKYYSEVVNRLEVKIKDQKLMN